MMEAMNRMAFDVLEFMKNKQSHVYNSDLWHFTESKKDADKAARVAKAKAAEAKAKARVAKAKASAAKAKAKVKAAKKGTKDDADLRAYFYEKLGITRDGDVEYGVAPKAKNSR